MYDFIKEKIDGVIKSHVPQSVLFSGGIDSSAILYHAHKYNPDVIGITVGIEGKDTSDIFYSSLVASQLNIKHKIYKVNPKDVYDTAKIAVRILKCFNPEWISSTTTLLLGTMYAKSLGLRSISGGEGADDLLGSFPFFTQWKGNMKSLEQTIEARLREIPIMSAKVSESMGMEYIAPFQAEEVKKAILSIPIKERMHTEGEIKTKYPLRKSYEGILPSICITRPQTMAFSGSGIYETMKKIGENIPDAEFEQAKEHILKFNSKFEYALFKIYREQFELKQEKNGCIHCGSNMGNNKINCTTCATLQIDGREIEFDGR